MSSTRLRLRYRAAPDLASHLGELRERGAMLVPLASPPADLAQYQPIVLDLVLGERVWELAGQVLQIISGLGIVFAPGEPGAVASILGPELAGGAVDPAAARPPEVTPVDGETAAGVSVGAADGADEADEAGGADEGGDADEGDGVDEGDEGAQGGGAAAARKRRTFGPLSFSIEKLAAEWVNLPLADRIRVARYGKRAARALVLRQGDPQLQAFLIANPHISIEEIAALAGLGNLDPSVLSRIATNPEWTQSTMVVRNLLCHPKATLPQVTRLADRLSTEELRRLTRTGKVRASVKQLLMKKIVDRGERR
jgi:hypothetical protein